MYTLQREWPEHDVGWAHKDIRFDNICFHPERGTAVLIDRNRSCEVSSPSHPYFSTMFITPAMFREYRKASYGFFVTAYNHAVTGYHSYRMTIITYGRAIGKYNFVITFYNRVLGSYNRVVTSYSIGHNHLRKVPRFVQHRENQLQHGQLTITKLYLAYDPSINGYCHAVPGKLAVLPGYGPSFN